LNAATSWSLAQTVAGKGGEAQAAMAALEMLSLRDDRHRPIVLHCHRRMTKPSATKRAAITDSPSKGNQSKAGGHKPSRDSMPPPQQNEPLPANRRDRAMAATNAPGLRHPLRPSRGKKDVVVWSPVGRIEKLAHRQRQDQPQVRCYGPLTSNVGRKQLLAGQCATNWGIENQLHWPTRRHDRRDLGPEPERINRPPPI